MRSGLLLILACAPLIADGESAMLEKMDGRTARYGTCLARDLGQCELRYKENQSAASFTVTENIAGMPTAFSAGWGQGSPAIGDDQSAFATRRFDSGCSLG